jgi:ornithine cyclodeaminase/alanine dehydrogenase-like protein (mu-crystallin family)
MQLGELPERPGPGEWRHGGDGRPLYFTEEDVRTLLEADPNYVGMVDTFESAFRDYARGTIVTPDAERIRLVWPPKANVRPYDRDMRILPAMVPSINAAGLRMGCKGEVNPGSASYTILLEFDRMCCLAIMEDHYLHGVRSGVPTGVGVRHLAKPAARRLGVIGCGRISAVQVAATLGQRPIELIKVFSRRPEAREAFAAEQEQKFGIRTVAVGSAEEAVSDADIVVSATNSHNATVFDGNWLPKGCFVASVTPGEIDATTALRSRVVLTSSNRVATDYTPQEPIASLVASGQLDLGSMPLLSEVLEGTAEGRQSEDQIVFLFSPGIGFLDMAAARRVYDIATGTENHQLLYGR